MRVPPAKDAPAHALNISHKPPLFTRRDAQVQDEQRHRDGGFSRVRDCGSSTRAGNRGEKRDAQ